MHHPVDLAAIDALIDLLRQQSFSAIASLRMRSPALRQHLGTERFASLAACIVDLRFGDALAAFDGVATPFGRA